MAGWQAQAAPLQRYAKNPGYGYLAGSPQMNGLNSFRNPSVPPPSFMPGERPQMPRPGVPAPPSYPGPINGRGGVPEWNPLVGSYPSARSRNTKLGSVKNLAAWGMGRKWDKDAPTANPPMAWGDPSWVYGMPYGVAGRKRRRDRRDGPYLPTPMEIPPDYGMNMPPPAPPPPIVNDGNVVVPPSGPVDNSRPDIEPLNSAGFGNPNMQQYMMLMRMMGIL